MAADPGDRDARGDRRVYRDEHRLRARWHRAHADAHDAEADGSGATRDAALNRAFDAECSLRRLGTDPCGHLPDDAAGPAGPSGGVAPAGG